MSRSKPALLLLPLIVAVGFLAATSPARAADETVLLNFNRNNNQPFSPMGGVIFDAAGNLYGTTVAGVIHSSGSVYELTPLVSGGFSGRPIFNFPGDETNGNEPEAPLIFDSAGNLYGTTIFGGIDDGGVVFQLSRDTSGAWHEKVLYRFRGGADGYYPQGPLTIDAAGNVYGTTLFGGYHKGCENGCGTVFELSPNANGTWTKTTLHAFEYGRHDGGFPVAGVTLDPAGNLYGTTQLGGSNLDGTVFELSFVNGSWTENILYNFCSQKPNCADGQLPSAKLIFDATGNLYSTTQAGGVGAGCEGAPCGTVFELSPSTNSTWTETVLYSFCSVANCADGALPTPNALVFDSSGNLYGTTAAGGLQGTTCLNPYGCGTVYELSPGFGGLWSEAVLYAFPPDGLHGSEQISGVVLDSQGNLYGTTVGGGKYNGGVVFEVSP
jgi:uncharacterized repeat protein (TIGR03803 family)